MYSSSCTIWVDRNSDGVAWRGEPPSWGIVAGPHFLTLPRVAGSCSITGLTHRTVVGKCARRKVGRGGFAYDRSLSRTVSSLRMQAAGHAGRSWSESGMREESVGLYTLIHFISLHL